MAGRKPKPTELKVLQGNPGKRKLEKNAPKAPPIEDSTPPAFLDKLAKEEWERVIPGLLKIGVITQADVMILAGYCQYYSRWVQAEDAVQKEGMTYHTYTKTGDEVIRKNPNVEIAKMASAEMRAFATEIGMTPSTRTRVHGKEADKPKGWSID